MVSTIGHWRTSVARIVLSPQIRYVNILPCADSGTVRSYLTYQNPFTAHPFQWKSKNAHNKLLSVPRTPQQHLWTYRGNNLRRAGSDNRRWFASTSGRNTQAAVGEAAVEERTTRTVELPVGGNGHVVLEISNLVLSTSQANGNSQARDILVHLPPGLDCDVSSEGQRKRSPRNTLEDGNGLLSAICMSETAKRQNKGFPPPVIVQIKYRLSSLPQPGSSEEDYRFPTPIHDVAVAFDWILENQDEICYPFRDNGQQQRTASEDDIAGPRVFVFGSRIGGSLAIMLALTQPNDIHAVSVLDPVTEWIGPDEIAASTTSTPLTSIPPKKRNKPGTEDVRSRTISAADALINVRTRLFRNPAGFFDPFASPLLFLRAPGRDTPLWRTARPEAEIVDETIVEAMKRDGGVEISEAETREAVRERGYGPYDDDWHTAEPGFIAEADQYELSGPISPPQTVNTDQTLTDLSALSLDDHKAQCSGQSDDSEPQALTEHFPFSPDTLTSEPSSRQSTTDLSPTSTTVSELSDSQSIADLTSLHSTADPTLNPPVPPSPRRRKVLRRWPPMGRPEDVDLPYIKVFTTVPPSHPDTSPQPPSELQSKANGHDNKFNSRRQRVSHGLSNDQIQDLAYILHPQAKELVDVMKRACFWGRESGLAEDRVSLELVETDEISHPGDHGVEIEGGDGGDEGAAAGRTRDETAGNLKIRSGEVLREVVDWFRVVRNVEK